MLISGINLRISTDTAGRPGQPLDFQRQYDRKPARCQRNTVSGRTIASAFRAFGNSWKTQPSNHLFVAEKGNRVDLPRRNTMICWRSTNSSASSADRDRNRSTNSLESSLSKSAIGAASPDSSGNASRIQFAIWTGYLDARLRRARAKHCTVNPGCTCSLSFA